MSLANTSLSYGAIARFFHWSTALLILVAIPLGVIAHGLPYETDAELARKATLFSIHKTVGIAAFFVALARILWALTQRKPAAVHPERR
ncbi:MAG: cytochrome b/b6 domain-containing protein, partial [Pseudomonadota bacterium]